MKTNMGIIDRIIRILIVIVIAILYFLEVIQGRLALILGIIAIVFAITSFVRFCPIYWFLGIKTCKNKE
ncbi:MAG: DUF2892 domain-containing protein [Bacteroidales bacterium]|nr:DUF2892 domain-containing protein [Bacteroidales bacterium]MDD3012004.1 DUF2892 domain-containing protein [Bacteroidales bacterium]MDD3962324.1 DUF2892 domain-containing protein [Bacteroidales bacterium]MDY0287169.1 DUF2892 domain-containing protein [Bacteroidales bacterium]